MNINTVLSLVLLVSTMILFYIGHFAWKRDKLYVSLSLFPVTIYSSGYAFEILCTNIEWVKFWVKVEYLGGAFLGALWLMFALNFTGYIEKFKKRTLMLLYIMPVITLIINYTNDYHHLFYKKMYMNYQGVFPILEVIHGPWYWVHTGYTYLMMLIGIIIFIMSYLKATAIVRKQILILVIAWIIPWIADMVYIFGWLHFDIDLAPVALCVSAIMYSFSILRFKFLKLTPIALEKVFYNMIDGVIILDSENNIVDFNNSSKEIIPELKDIDVGDKKIDVILKAHEEIIKAVNSDSYNESLISTQDKEKLRCYKLNINNIYENNGEIIGKILILTDITEFQLQQKKLSDNVNFLEALMNAIPNPIFFKNKHGVYNHCNTALTEYLGIKEEEFIGHNSHEIFEEKSAEAFDKLDKELMDEKGNVVFESEFMHKDDTYHHVIFNKSVVIDEEDNINGLVGVVMDVTEERTNRERMSKLLKLKEVMLKIGYSINEISNLNDLLQLILNEVIDCVDSRSSGSILLLDKENNLRIAVAKGYNSEEIKRFLIKLEEHFAWFNNGENINETVIFNGIDEMNYKNMLDTTGGTKIKSSISSPIIIDGQLYGFLNIDSEYNKIFNEGDLELMEYMRNQASIAIANHKLYEEIVHLSRYDKLTNVYNRSYFERLLNDNINNYNSNKKEFFATIFDLNGLKFVNDNYGHLAGDKLIKTFSTGLTNLAGNSDIIGRFGGDEFVGVFFDVDLQNLINKFEKLIEHFKNNPITFDENKIICSYSYGIVNFPVDGNKFDELIKIADKRMYEYKRMVKRIYKIESS